MKEVMQMVMPLCGLKDPSPHAQDGQDVEQHRHSRN